LKQTFLLWQSPQMTSTVALYSKLYMDGREDDSWSARPTPRLLEHLHGLDGDDTARWIAVLGGVRVAVGDPVPSENRWSRNLYIPQWILESAGMAGEGEEIQVRFERCEVLPKATSLGFKILGEVPEGIDMRELLEGALSSLGVLEAGQIIPAPILEGVHLLVQTCEPGGGPVFLDGAEIALDLESDVVPEVPEPVRPPTPLTETVDFNEFIDPVALVPPRPSGSRCPPGAFIPFSGVGRRLCD
jgi:hypothetical protein